MIALRRVGPDLAARDRVFQKASRFFRRFSGLLPAIERGIDGPDRDARNPVRLYASLGESLKYADLIGPRAPRLEARGRLGQ